MFSITKIINPTLNIINQFRTFFAHQNNTSSESTPTNRPITENLALGLGITTVERKQVVEIL